MTFSLFQKRSAAGLFWLAAFSFSLFGQKNDSLAPLPPFHPERAKTVDLQHVSLDLRFDFAQKAAFGSATLELSLFEKGKKVLLDAAHLAISSVELVEKSGSKTLAFDVSKCPADDGLEIILPRKMAAKKPFSIRIFYRTEWPNLSDPTALGGSVGKGLRYFEKASADLARRRQIWSASEIDGARFWFPTHDALDDFFTSDIRATVEKGLTVVSNGSLVEKKANADGSTTFFWRCEKAHAAHQTSIAVGEWIDVLQQKNGVDLHSFSYPDEVAATQASVVRLPEMLAFFEEKLGVNYPFSSYSQVFVQDLPNLLGHAGTATVTENMVDDSSTHAEFFYLWDLTEAEALADQWFGAATGAASVEHFWLQKAFGRHLSGLFTAEKNGRDEFLLYQLGWDQAAVAGDFAAGVLRPVVSKNWDDAAAFAQSNTAYAQPACFLWTLQKEIGDAAFWASLRLFLTENAQKPATTDDFLRAVEKAAGRKMGWFFDQWLRSASRPAFEISKKWSAEKSELHLEVRQIQTLDPKNRWPQTAFFQGHVEVEIDGRVERIWLEPRAENVFSFKNPTEPKLVNFDFESAWPKEITFKKPLEELLFQFENSRDVLARSAALNELAALAAGDSAEKTAILTAFRRVVLDRAAFWRFRANVIGKIFGLTNGKIDAATEAMALEVIEKTPEVWVRRSAINLLGTAREARFASLFIRLLGDWSDRVANAAAVALGKTKSPDAFSALEKLAPRPSWKQQSVISALAGMKELGDERAFSFAFSALKDVKTAHWTLATPVWDCRVAAADCLFSLGKGADAWPFLAESLEKSLAENDRHGIFYTAFLMATLGDSRAFSVFEKLKKDFSSDEKAVAAIEAFRSQLEAAIKK